MLRDPRQVWGDAGGAAGGHRPGGDGEEDRHEGRSSGGWMTRHFIHNLLFISTCTIGYRELIHDILGYVVFNRCRL